MHSSVPPFVHAVINTVFLAAARAYRLMAKLDDNLDHKVDDAKLGCWHSTDSCRFWQSSWQVVAAAVM